MVFAQPVGAGAGLGLRAGLGDRHPLVERLARVALEARLDRGEPLFLARGQARRTLIAGSADGHRSTLHADLLPRPEPQERAMSLDGTYDDGNIFAKILRGEMPAARVFEDEHVFAFMDVFPQARGHTLVIPKHSTARNLLEEEPQVLSNLILGVQRVT